MAQDQKKAVREAAQKFSTQRTEALMARRAEPITQTDLQAIERVLKGRGVDFRNVAHGEILPEDGVQHVIRIEELQMTETEPQRKQLMGFPEAASMLTGVITALVTYRDYGWRAFLFAFVSSAIVLLASRFVLDYFRALGRPTEKEYKEAAAYARRQREKRAKEASRK